MSSRETSHPRPSGTFFKDTLRKLLTNKWVVIILAVIIVIGLINLAIDLITGLITLVVGLVVALALILGGAILYSIVKQKFGNRRQ